MVQVNNTPITVRAKFYKTGKLQYISHLDLVRTMMKIIVRAKLPLWYTEGFNPKPKLTFAAPLSIGTESLCEFMDIRLTERVPEGEIMKNLNENLTPDMQVTEVYYPEDKMTSLKYLAYKITLDIGCGSCDGAEQIKNLLSSENITVMKKTKSGDAQVNIKPLIKSAEVFEEGGNLVIDCVLSADSANFLNPEYIIKAIREKLGILTSENLLSESYSILRYEAYLENMEAFR